MTAESMRVWESYVRELEVDDTLVIDVNFGVREDSGLARADDEIVMQSAAAWRRLNEPYYAEARIKVIEVGRKAK